nr:DNA repair protein RAD16-like [Ipomoea batatas]
MNDESSERKRLYNEVIELKGNIRVFCRCRPLNSEEVANGSTSVVDFKISIHVNFNESLLEVKQSAEGTQEVPGLIEARVYGTDEVWELLQFSSPEVELGLLDQLMLMNSVVTHTDMFGKELCRITTPTFFTSSHACDRRLITLTLSNTLSLLWQEVKNAVDASNVEQPCGICHDSVEEPVVPSCAHTFCRTCLEEFSSSMAKVSCPTCSKPLTTGLLNGSGNRDSKNRTTKRI